MGKQEVLQRLIGMFQEVEMKGRRGHSDYWANETRNLSKSAIILIKNYEDEGNEALKEIKEEAIQCLKEAIHYADKYYGEGWDYRARKNPDVLPHEFINPAYNGLELFLYTVDESFRNKKGHL